MQNSTDSAYWDAPLTVENTCIFYFLWDQGVHVLFWKLKQNFCISPASITCSKSTIEVLEQVIKYVQIQEK